jgi:hypothetical protein
MKKRGIRRLDATSSHLVINRKPTEPGLTNNQGQHRQSNLKSPDYLRLQFFLSNYTVQLQCLQHAPGRRVTEKSHFSTLNVGLARTGNRTRATCLAGSVSRHSAIHYALYSVSSFPLKYLSLASYFRTD